MNTKELVIHNDFANQMIELDRIQDTCKKLLTTKHYAKIGEEGIHAIISKSKALGIHPFEALNGGFHCINGKVGMSTEMMAALVRKRGHSVIKDEKSTNECVILHGKRADSGDSWTCTFTRQDAERAGLWNGPTWKKYPGIMLYNRCMSMLFRQLFPDLSLGAGYVEDELKEIAKVDEYKLPISPCDVTNIDQKTPMDQVTDVGNVVDDKPTMVTKDQWEELKSLIGKCTSRFHDFAWDLIHSKGVTTDDDFENMPMDEFIKLKNGCLGNIQKQINLEKSKKNEANSA